MPKKLADYKWGVLLIAIAAGAMSVKLFASDLNVDWDKIDIVAIISSAVAWLEVRLKNMGRAVESVHSELTTETPAPTPFPQTPPSHPDNSPAAIASTITLPAPAPIVADNSHSAERATLATSVLKVANDLQSMRGESSERHAETIQRHDELRQSLDDYRSQDNRRHDTHESRLNSLETAMEQVAACLATNTTRLGNLEAGVAKIGENVCLLCRMPDEEPRKEVA